MKNARKALSWFKKNTNYSFYDEEDVENFIYKRLESHEPSETEYAKDFNHESFTGNFTEIHSIEISPLHTKSKHPEFIEVEVYMEFINGGGGSVDIKFIA